MPRKGIVNKAIVPRVRNTKRGKKGTRYVRYFPSPNQMARYKARLKAKRKQVGL